MFRKCIWDSLLAWPKCLKIVDWLFHLWKRLFSNNLSNEDVVVRSYTTQMCEVCVLLLPYFQATQTLCVEF